MSRKSKKSNNGTKILIIALILIIIIAGVILTVKSNKSENNPAPKTEENNNEGQAVQDSNIKIVDVESKSRPYAVMINNNHAAWPQCGLQDAYLVYEIIVEGGITRMMALYKDADTAKIGSVRSARHYFIDYVQENDAIYVHWGSSSEAEKELVAIDHLDGTALEGSVFFRDKSLDRAYEHTGFTSMEKVKNYADNKGYTRDTNKDLLLNYSADEIDMASLKGAETATSIKLKYSDYHTTSYEYDETNKVYKRSMSGKANVDLETGEQYTAKNIIIYQVENYTLEGAAGSGKQGLNNVGKGTGYLVTGGYSVPITWEKSARNAQTVYKYSNGEEIKVNDGNTFIQICPINSNITIE